MSIPSRWSYSYCRWLHVTKLNESRKTKPKWFPFMFQCRWQLNVLQRNYRKRLKNWKLWMMNGNLCVCIWVRPRKNNSACKHAYTARKRKQKQKSFLSSLNPFVAFEMRSSCLSVSFHFRSHVCLFRHIRSLYFTFYAFDFSSNNNNED